VRNLQPANKRKRRDIFIAVGHLGELVLKIANVRLETVTGSHFDSEEVVVLFGLSAGGVLGGEHLGYLLKVERMPRQRVEPIRGHAF